ncbi:MAG TPA: FHA domain-containing protein, partial [Labilithrix sp.]
MSNRAWDDEERPTALRPPPMEEARVAVPQTRIPPAVSRRLMIVEGPDAGAVFALDLNAPRILIGTSPVCEVRLTDPSVSRRHAAIETIEGRLRVSDVNSTNGTFIDGVAVVQAYLEDGETLRIGGTTIRLEADPDALPKPLADAECFGRMVGASRAMRRL